ncbi:sorting and assembly machinery component 50 homolog [Chenopodium quinoa]|uniref:sorting and assembly machinery component 50 homolog n=1 Tax=Chenopodium quinoa TaxID=63459 RepID=UPI000B77F495|nr:sorting and assembly machinery component 50 homolog [Chenopodium quinoa]
MALQTEEPNPIPNNGDADDEPKPEEDDNNNGEEEEDDDEEDEVADEDDDYDDESRATAKSNIGLNKEKMTKFANRLSSEPITLRVHDVIIKGNLKTKDSVIEAEIMDDLKRCSTLQEIFQAAAMANLKLRQLDIFDTVNFTIDSGPTELPGTANVVIDVLETKNPLTGEIGLFTKPGARSWSLEGGLKLKNLFGYADVWDGSVSYGWDQTTELSTGVTLPRLRHWPSPVFARASLLSQDWLKFSSYKERALGLGLGLISTRNHEMVYNLTWRTLTDPSQMAGESVRRQLGHSLLSSLKYTYKVDQRNSPLRPTRGYAYSFTTLLAGLNPDNRSARFLRQECDFRYAVPLGFCRAALNLGVSAGLIFPWGKGFLDRPSSLPDRFFLGGNTSPVCSLGGPSSVLGFKCRGLGPTEPRRQTRDKPDGDSSVAASERDAVGGDLAVSAFADLSFDLPLTILKEAGVHAHIFASTGNLVKLTENEWRKFSTKGFMQSFRSTVGCGVIVPTKLLRLEVNYCHVVKQFEHDHGKTGVQFCFSSPF